MSKIGLSFVVEETLARVVSLITDKTILAWSLSQRLRLLLELLTEIRSVLPDTEKKQMGNYIVSYWLKKLREVAYQAEEVIDELAYEIHCPKVTQLNFLKKVILNIKLAHKVKIVNQSLHKMINKAIVEFGFEATSAHRIIPHRDLDRVTGSVLDNPIIGREADASKIINLLTRSDKQVLTVVPIVGMDGLGKTALAKLVCQRAMALKLFDVKMWVCVSEKCDELKVLGKMLQSLNASMGGLTSKDAILQQLKKELMRKRFLLVLDDVWEDVSRWWWWDNLKTWLLKICTNNGNVVLVTTRSEKLASIVETSSQHRHTLDLLSDDECWLILKKRAFRNVTVQSNLEAIAREITKKCRGVPLAAKVLGGTLGFNRDEEAWLKIRDSHFLKARDIEESVKSILILSFDHFDAMFYTFKLCLALCSVFPKGFLIIKEDLIQLWMGERFADSRDTGNEYFHALLANSFFHDAECDDDGNVIKCKMHNLVHDLTLSLEKSEMLIHYLYADYQSRRTSKALPNNTAKYLSTIILNGAPFQRSWNSKSLRTLSLNDVDMEILSSSVYKLKHLRYLHVSNTKLGMLPKSISEIYMVQILTLSNCSCEQLPHLGDLPYLKFLKISHMERVKCIGNESYEANNIRQEVRLFPALKSLSLSWMENLTAWYRPSHANKVVIFPRLENLSIQSCAKLTGFPMRDLSTLTKIEIKDCEELRFIFDEH